MDECGLTPPEAAVAAELIIWQLMSNAMDIGMRAGGDALQLAKLSHVRTLNRLSSRVEAWPAKTHDRM